MRRLHGLGELFRLMILALGMWLAACGDDGGNSGGTGSSKSQLEQALEGASKRYGIPHELIKAVAFRQSHFTLSRNYALYQGKEVGPLSENTIFGLPASKLGLEVAGSEVASYSEQIEVYGQWVGDQLSHLQLSPSVSTSAELFEWVWEIAKLHVVGKHVHNTRVIFALEIIEVLNQGFQWTDGSEENTVALSPRIPALDVENFEPELQKVLNLNTRRSQIGSAERFPYFYGEGEGESVPIGIRIMHCPFTLAKCLAFQQRQVGEFRLRGHYLIPSSDLHTGLPMQLLSHRDRVYNLDDSGDPVLSQEVIILLAGASGRYEGGRRQPANPNWLTAWQLHRLGEVVEEVCVALERTYDKPFETCMKSIRIQSPTSSQFHWGDVLDYDSDIFATYLQQGELGSKVTFELAKTFYEKGEWVPLHLKLPREAQLVELESLSRCSSGAVEWVAIESIEVRLETEVTFNKRFYHSGPNGTGEQYFRAKVLGSQGELLGWDTAQIQIHNFEDGYRQLPSGRCL